MDGRRRGQPKLLHLALVKAVQQNQHLLPEVLHSQRVAVKMATNRMAMVSAKRVILQNTKQPQLKVHRLR
jgi:hypothetical protein